MVIIINQNKIWKKQLIHKKEKLVIINKNKVKSKNLIYNIYAVIIRVHKAGIFDVLIKNDYEDYNLKINDICRISSYLFKKIPEDIWENILKRN